MTRATDLPAAAATQLNVWQQLAIRTIASRTNIVWTFASATTLAILLPIAWRYFSFSRLGRNRSSSHVVTDPRDSDPSILKKHTSYRSFSVPNTGFTYPSIRIVHFDHPQADKLPKEPSTLPLLVFIHGLGGSAAQFAPLLTRLINTGPCLCIDLPGCGLSDFAPEDDAAYTQPALASLLATIIEHYRDARNGQGVVMVAHSMGCSLSARLAADDAHSELSKHLVGLVALCPQGSGISEARKKSLQRLTGIPTFLFDVLRGLDKIGGLYSSSVNRFVGPDPAYQTRKLQYRFNSQSRTDVFKRMLRGCIPDASDAASDTGLAGFDRWEKIKMPVLLIGGESDNVTSPEETRKLESRLAQSQGRLAPIAHAQFDGMVGASIPQKGVKMCVLPAPASHALLFAQDQLHVVSGLIKPFLADHIDKRLADGWQLQYLTKEGKWDVKNLEKWQKTEQVSEPIDTLFRAMKTMREVDETHNPALFAAHWKGKIAAIVDISHEAPVYDPARLDAGGIAYHKFPTVSKMPPTPEEIAGFIDLVDSIRATNPDAVVAVHCHYGFNRTGYFIVCYLVEKRGWTLRDALREFAEKRAPGIKHGHFVDELYVRYCSGLLAA